MTDQIQHPAPTDPSGTQPPAASVPGESPKLFIATWLFSWLLGGLGVDRFYLGKVGTGIIKLITLGGVGVWWLIDLIITLAGGQRDKQGRPLAGYAANKKLALIVTGAFVVLSIIVSAINGANAGSRGSAPEAPTVEQEEPAASDAPAAEPAAEEPAAEEPVVPAAQSWADESFGTFAPITQTGTGDNLITLPAGASAGLVTATHDGARNFVLSVLDAGNQPTGDLLVNTIGAYSGNTVYGFNVFSEGTTLQITADGNWSVTVAPVSAAPLLAASGAGDAVFLYDGGAGKLTATHDGSRNFVVYEETSELFSMGLLVNEIGAYSGTVPLSEGPSVIEVTADGNWTLAVG